MSIVRVSADQKNKRVFGFRAWHPSSRQMVHVRACGFDDIDENAIIVAPGKDTPSIVKMGEIVLLQDTNTRTVDGRIVYEGDIVVVEVQNEFGSFEEVIGEVTFEVRQWGYNIKIMNSSGLQLTGAMSVVDVIGNVFEGIDKDKQEFYDKQKRHKGGKK